MVDVTVQKRGEVYQYKFEIASIDGKRKFKNTDVRSRFPTARAVWDDAHVDLQDHKSCGDRGRNVL